VVHDLRFETEVGESLPVVIQERVDPGVAVPDLSGSDDLVSRMAEGGDATIEVVGVFSFHMLTDRRLTELAQTRHHAWVKGGR
jgi:hypothetical protein